MTIEPVPLGVRAAVGADSGRSFEELFREHHAGLFRFAYLLALDEHLAEEAAAEAFAATFPQWQRGRVKDPGAYLRRAAANVVRKRWLRRRLERREEQRRTTAAGNAPFDTGMADRDALLAALAQLPVRQRAVVVLRFLEDRSEAETASLLGISTGTVKTHAHRGTARLRTLLEGDDHEL